MGRVVIGEVIPLGRAGGILDAYRTLALAIDPPLTEAEFGGWLDHTFRNGGPARLWGNPIPLGPTKAHVYGLCLASSRRVDMEFKAGRFFLIAPEHGDDILPEIAGRIAESLAEKDS